MYTTLRPYATAGIALLGASAIAVAPVVATPQLTDVRVAAPGVALSAAIDPLTPLLDLFNTSETNFAGLVNAWLEAPAPVLQQIIANQISYVGQLPDIGAILEQMGANVVAAAQAPFAEDVSSMAEMHQVIYDMILNGIPGAIEPAPPQLVPLLKFTTTYLSGALVGLAGLVMNPVLALGGGIHSVFASLTGENPDIAAAINTLINIPTAMVDAFLNGGQTMNVTPLLTALGMELPIPGMEVDLAFGGLLSAGGSMFNSLNLVFGPGDVVPGQGAGFIGSLIALTKVIAQAIGWDGQGNPLAPPLNTSTLRQAADTSLIAGDTVTLPVAADVVEEAAPGGQGPEFSTQPVVSVEEEPAVDETAVIGDDAPAEEPPVEEAPVEEDAPLDEDLTDEDVTDEKDADEDLADEDAADTDSGADDSASDDSASDDSGSDDSGSETGGSADSGSGTGGSDD
ncbi:hypothetical protein CYL16_08130 [Mycobacterium sp. EPG1]|nr:hypothetical protein CYL16_08130 [Mycobacterium sp. EPG1]